MNIYTELIKEQGFMVFCIQGNSMEPLLREGDSIKVFNVIFLKPGECYIFKHNGKMMIHRLAGKHREDYFFIGDNSNCFEKVKRDQIYGILYGNPSNKMAKQLIRMVNWLYLQTIRWKPLCRIGGIRKRIIRAIYRSFHEKTISETPDLY
jgi:hypothetical protein